jgi:hypothetical protein
LPYPFPRVTGFTGTDSRVPNHLTLLINVNNHQQHQQQQHQ